MNRRRMLFWSVVMACEIAAVFVCQAQMLDMAEWGVWYEVTETGTPRTVRIHCLRVDLSAGKAVPRAIIAPDPDGDGPAEAALTSPLALVKDRPVLAFVNACPWDALPDASGTRDRRWYEGQPVDISGVAVSGGVARSALEKGTCPVWLDTGGRMRIGACTSATDVVEGVAGFLQIVRDGEVVCRPSTNLAPRTAVGVDRDGQTLWLVVADGRQPGYSEGMSYDEVAAYMKELGCWHAAGMDGGGSSIMGLLSTNGTLRVVNSPSDRDFLGRVKIRPLPLVLAIEKEP